MHNHSIFDKQPSIEKEQLLLQKLTTELAGGKLSAWEELYKLLYDPLAHFVYHIVRSKEDALDIAQEVFVYLWQNQHKIQPDKNIKSYLYKIAKSLSYDCLSNRSKSDGFSSLSEYPEPPAIEDISPDNLLVADEMRILIAMSLESMPRQRRQVFEMSRYEGLSHDEIATKLGISNKTVRNHIYTATKELKELLCLAAIFLTVGGLS